MKIRQLAAVAAALIMPTLTSNPVQAQNTTLNAPIGWLTATTNPVRAGTIPVLSWGITYPSKVIDFVNVAAPATVTPKQRLRYEVRVLGAGVTASNSNGSNMSFVPTEAVFSFNNSSYNRIFYGTNNAVIPSTVVASGTADVNQPLRFGGRFFFNNTWSHLYTSSTGTNNVRALVDGDFPPTTYSLVNAPTLESFIRPYLDSTGRVKIGPMDVIIFMELTHTDAQNNQMGYDCQDMVLLVTFQTLPSGN
jgi:hypothetical protein